MACGTIHFGAKKIKSKSKFLGININEVCLLILSNLNNAVRRYLRMRITALSNILRANKSVEPIALQQPILNRFLNRLGNDFDYPTDNTQFF